MTNEQLLDVAQTLEQMAGVPLRDGGLLALRIAGLRTTVTPLARTVRAAFTELQKRHQLKDGEGFVFRDGRPVWRNVFAYDEEREKLAADELAVALPEVRPLRYEAFPKSYPWCPAWLAALQAVGWLVVEEADDAP